MKKTRNASSIAQRAWDLRHPDHIIAKNVTGNTLPSLNNFQVKNLLFLCSVLSIKGCCMKTYSTSSPSSSPSPSSSFSSVSPFSPPSFSSSTS